MLILPFVVAKFHGFCMIFWLLLCITALSIITSLHPWRKTLPHA